MSDTPALGVNQNANAILQGNLTVSDTFANASFAAGSIMNLHNNPNEIAATISEWMSTDIVNNDARAIVSLNTCNGCHGGETLTPFLHVTTRQAGETVPDPANPNVARSYSDLDRRAADLVQVLCHGGAGQVDTGAVARPTGI